MRLVQAAIAASLVLAPSALLAQAAAAPPPAPAPPPAFTVTGGATIVSDYRFRGISQTDRRFALQGTFTVAHSSGFYASVWGSSIAHIFGPVTAKATANYAPSQAGLSIGNGNEDNLYLAGDLSAAIPHTPVSLSAHFGHTFGPSYLSIGDEYSDWNLGASVTFHNIAAGVAYVDTDGSFITPSGRNASSAGVVASLGAAF